MTIKPGADAQATSKRGRKKVNGKRIAKRISKVRDREITRCIVPSKEHKVGTTMLSGLVGSSPNRHKPQLRVHRPPVKVGL
ncbi:hypothetical protein BC936DRAFT_149129 [Jimgerdemannia flammicorona]|uniref:Uncharacterized protein n=1 Tax=Jimgerdemannia flammicorona TaxID=994334 RepID=A0A433D1I0_9FUNG|nr:hypothetical protein BC936DRAFT_149129 [Jimgerdemannia flammicorona]